jgi:tetratricopeptide (TPR) repeat protein
MRAAGAALLLALAALPARAALDVDALWNYADPAASEARFRATLAAGAQGDDALVLRTQIARTFSLRSRFDAAHAELDAIEPLLAAAGLEPRVRAWLERGRTLRSSGQPADAKPLFVRAFVSADAAQLERLAADALHMVALVEPVLDERIAWSRRTVEYAQRAKDPRAQGWQAAALNNIGSDLREAGRLAEALAAFEQARAAYEGVGCPGPVRVARWQVANTLRLLGRRDEALAMQLALERDAEAANEPDRYVFEELALLYEARGDGAAAAAARARAQALAK